MIRVETWEDIRKPQENNGKTIGTHCVGQDFKKTRLKKSEMLRALREEFSEAPLEIGGFVEDADLRKVLLL